MNSWPIEPQAWRDRLLSKPCSGRFRVLRCLCLIPLMTACSATTSTFVKVPATPIPASLLAFCQPSAPPNNPLTFGDAVLWNELLLTDLENCNTQLDGIRQFEELHLK